jgi:hypothetical protein
MLRGDGSAENSNFCALDYLQVHRDHSWLIGPDFIMTCFHRLVVEIAPEVLKTE